MPGCVDALLLNREAWSRSLARRCKPRRSPHGDARSCRRRRKLRADGACGRHGALRGRWNLDEGFSRTAHLPDAGSQHPRRGAPHLRSRRRRCERERAFRRSFFFARSRRAGRLAVHGVRRGSVVRSGRRRIAPPPPLLLVARTTRGNLVRRIPTTIDDARSARPAVMPTSNRRSGAAESVRGLWLTLRVRRVGSLEGERGAEAPMAGK